MHKIQNFILHQWDMIDSKSVDVGNVLREVMILGKNDPGISTNKFDSILGSNYFLI